MTTTRPDTLLKVLDTRTGTIGGLAWPNGYRSLHGEFTDERTVFDVSKYGDYVPIVNQDTRHGRPTKDDCVGYLTSWHADKVGLWAEFQPFRTRHADKLFQAVSAGELYFCIATDDLSVCNLTSGYFSRRVIGFFNVTHYPTYRPNRWPTPDDYLKHLLAVGANIPDDVCSDNEAMPLDGPSFTPYAFGKPSPMEFDQWA